MSKLDIEIGSEFHCVGCGSKTPILQQHKFTGYFKTKDSPDLRWISLMPICFDCYTELQKKYKT